MQVRSNVKMTHGQCLRGKVTKLHATTMTVAWEDGTVSRVARESAVLHGPQPKSLDRVRPSYHKKFDRRFGSIIAQRMEELKFTYDDLSERSGISKRHLLRLAAYATEDSVGLSAGAIERLAVALNVVPGDFWTPA
jgi:DNA-binding Xre family transcriptional regulator